MPGIRRAIQAWQISSADAPDWSDETQRVSLPTVRAAATDAGTAPAALVVPTALKSSGRTSQCPRNLGGEPTDVQRHLRGDDWEEAAFVVLARSRRFLPGDGRWVNRPRLRYRAALSATGPVAL